jgi:CheY-like chemotaxis protein
MGFDDIDVMNVPGHVLIVEDDADTREMLVTLLGDEGFHAVAAEDGLEALHLLRTVRHLRPETPCLVLLDLRMPRMSGNEFRRAQLADPVVASVPVAVMSGAVDAQELSRSLGAVATLPKPLDITFLLQVVRQHCTIQPQP